MFSVIIVANIPCFGSSSYISFGR